MAFVAALLVRGGSGVGRRAALAIVVNTASTVCVWIAALLIENQQGSLYWHLFNAPQGARAWLMAAAVLRVGLYPFHQWLPVELGKEPDRAVIIFIVPTVSGLALWARMAIAQALPEESIVPLLAMLSLVIGSVLAWRSAQPRNGLPFIALCLTGSVGLLAAAGASPAQLTAAAFNWMFINVSLFIARGLDRRQPYWAVGSLIALLSLAALPGTLGFVVQQGVVVNTIRQQQWLILLAVVVAQTFVMAAALRLILSEATESAPAHVVRKVVWGLALACGALPLLIFALADNALPALPDASELLSELNAIGLLAMFAPLAVGALLAWRVPLTRGTSDSGQAAWGRVLRLDWLNAALFYLVDRLTGFLRAAAGVFEGEGGLLWTVIVIVVVVVIYTAAL
jgi:formate hydrogenlyase subunit 3/multisubunit Na+/H+ antiporter MnhD subunit